LKNGIFCTWKQDHFSFSPLKNFFYPLGFNPLFHKSKTPEPLATTTACDESNFYEKKSTTIYVSPVF